jgi:AraC-like DNA-binding protein
MSEQYGGRDRLRELLDAVLDEDNRSLDDMAGDAFTSPYHFSRQLSRSAGEPPVAMKRRVMLERAAWQLRQGASVTDSAFAAGYESVEGFSRAFTRAYGHVPSAATHDAGSHWLPAPNGIHFHPPTSLWVHAKEQSMNPLTEQLVAHDLDDTRSLLEHAKQLPDEDYRRQQLPGNTVLCFDGQDESVADVLTHLVFTKEVWLAAIDGTDFPPERSNDVPTLLERHDEAAARWLATVRDIDRRGAWDDRLIDALCDPPESFVISSVVAHVLTFSAHRRQLARQLLRASGQKLDTGDPINWLRARHGEKSEEEPW